MSNISLFDKSHLPLLGRCALHAVILNKVAECERSFLFTCEPYSVESAEIAKLRNEPNKLTQICFSDTPINIYLQYFFSSCSKPVD
jgi:hypothetical protein